MNRYLLLTVIAGGVIIIDQASKYAIQHMMAVYDYIEVIPGLFSLTYIQNPGAAFGLFGKTTEAVRSVFLIGISFLALTVLFFMYARLTEKNLLIHVSIGMIIGGAVGNLIDRIRFHWVIDFLDFYWQGHHWPTFNLADAAITIGTIILMLKVLLPKREGIMEL
jgi:signal peptidase II